MAREVAVKPQDAAVRRYLRLDAEAARLRQRRRQEIVPRVGALEARLAKLLAATPSLRWETVRVGQAFRTLPGDHREQRDVGALSERVRQETMRRSLCRVLRDEIDGLGAGGARACEDAVWRAHEQAATLRVKCTHTVAAGGESDGGEGRSSPRTPVSEVLPSWFGELVALRDEDSGIARRLRVVGAEQRAVLARVVEELGAAGGRLCVPGVGEVELAETRRGRPLTRGSVVRALGEHLTRAGAVAGGCATEAWRAGGRVVERLLGEQQAASKSRKRKVRGAWKWEVGR